MTDTENILISIHPKYVQSMMTGEKSVELRRRPLRIASGSKVWIYTTLPRGAVEAIGIVEDVVEASPSMIWKRFSRSCGIPKAEFDAYFQDIDTGFAILFSSIEPLSQSFDLDKIRERLVTFQPPQFFKRLKVGSAELALFSSALAESH